MGSKITPKIPDDAMENAQMGHSTERNTMEIQDTDTEHFLHNLLKVKMNMIDIAADDTLSRNMAEFIRDQYFFMPKGGREVLLKEGRFGSLLESTWEGVQQEVALRFGVGRTYQSKLFKIVKGEPLVKPVILHLANQEFQPNKARIFQSGTSLILNRWCEPQVVYNGKGMPTEEWMEPWDEFLERWFPDREQRQYFEQWLAVTVVEPERNITGVPVLRSDQGTGKDMFADEVLTPLVGEGNFKNASIDQITEKHAEEIKFSSLVVINELEKARSRKTANELKRITEGGTTQVNPKGMSPYRMQSFTNFIIYSNKDNPLFIEEGDRRYWVPERLVHKVSAEETAEFIRERFVKWVLVGGLQMLRNKLECMVRDGLIDYDLFLKAPDTPQKAAITHVDMKPDHQERFVIEIEHMRGEWLHFTDIMEMDCVRGKLNQTEVREILKSQGWASNKKREGKKYWTYVDDPSKAYSTVRDPFIKRPAVGTRSERGESLECH